MVSKGIVHIVLRNPVHMLSFGFGAGLSPVAPGTMGTLIAIPIYLALASFSVLSYILFTIALFILGCWSAQKTAGALGVYDHPGVVIDEIVGYLVTMILVPATWYWVLLGFLLFRLFDILKPWPIFQIDRHLKGGFGVMADDLIAALYSLLLLHSTIWLVQNI